MTREEEAHPGLYERLVGGLAVLGEAGPEEVPSVLAALEIALLGDLGFGPRLTDCAVCGRAVPTRGTFLSPSLGGVLCRECRPRDPKARALAAPVAAALRTLARTPAERAGRIRLAPEHRRAIRAFLVAFVEWQLERPLRTARFLV
jgi:DNA repair protein RecO (recombination protein O)